MSGVNPCGGDILVRIFLQDLSELSAREVLTDGSDLLLEVLEDLEGVSCVDDNGSSSVLL